MSTARINLPDLPMTESGEFSLPLAGPATRFLAWLVDFGGILILLSVVNNVIALTGTFSVDAAIGLSILTTCAVPILYGTLFEGCWRGQTPGKRLLRLRVLDARGRRLGWRQVVIRNLWRAVDMLPGFYLVGGAACVFTARTQRLGDLAAGTVVARTERLVALDPSPAKRAE